MLKDLAVCNGSLQAAVPGPLDRLVGDTFSKNSNDPIVLLTICTTKGGASCRVDLFGLLSLGSVTVGDPAMVQPLQHHRCLGHHPCALKIGDPSYPARMHRYIFLGRANETWLGGFPLVCCHWIKQVLMEMTSA